MIEENREILHTAMLTLKIIKHQRLILSKIRIYRDYYQIMANFILAVLFQQALVSFFTFGFLRCPLVLVVYHA